MRIKKWFVFSLVCAAVYLSGAPNVVAQSNAVPWQIVSGTNLNAAANQAYQLTNALLTTVNLPSSANVGDTITLLASGAGGWTLPWMAHQTNVERVWISAASSADGSKLAAAAYDTEIVTGGQIYTSADSGMTWTPRDTNRFWMSIASSANGTKLIAADTGKNGNNGLVYTSTNSGVTWTPCNTLPSTNWWSVASSADGSRLVAVNAGYSKAQPGAIYISTNSGTIWTRCTNAPASTWFVAVCSADGSKLAATTGSSIYTSPDSGVTWTFRTNSNAIRITSSADGSKLLLPFFRMADVSTNSGVTWSTLSNAINWTTSASSSDGSKLTAVSNGDHPQPIYTSTDWGVTWTQMVGSPSAIWQTIACSADGSKLVAGVSGGPLYTRYQVNGGTTNIVIMQYATNNVWHPLDNALPWQIVSAPTVNAIANQAYLLKNSALTTVNLPSSAKIGDIITVSGSGAGGWQIVSPWISHQPRNRWISVASSADGIKLVAASLYEYIYTSTDSGVNWRRSPRGPKTNWISVASSADGSKLAAAANADSNPQWLSDQIYTSTDSGANWTRYNDPPATNWSAVASSANGNNLVAVSRGGSPSAGGYVYTSINSGVNWTLRTNAPAANWSAVASSADGSKLVATIHGGQIFTSTNAGRIWTAGDAPVARWYAVASSGDGSRLIAAMDGNNGQIYTSTNSGAHWTMCSNAPAAYWSSVASSSDGSKLIAAISGGPIYVSTDSGDSWTSYETNRNWNSVASSADGNKFVAVVDSGLIYTWQPKVVMSGGPGTVVTMQCVSNNVWQPLP